MPDWAVGLLDGTVHCSEHMCDMNIWRVLFLSTCKNLSCTERSLERQLIKSFEIPLFDACSMIYNRLSESK
jgi:hypothetical protein